jgi:hypothetical protein
MLLTKGILVILLLTNVRLLFTNNPLIHICGISIRNRLVYKRPFSTKILYYL